MTPTVTHDLEIAGKRTLSDEEWLQIQHTFYDGFAIVGGVGEMLSLISTGALAYLLRKQQTGFVLTLIGALCFFGTLAMFAFGNRSISQLIAICTLQISPATWRQTGDAWDAFHAISSVFATLAFITLLITLLRDIAQ